MLCPRDSVVSSDGWLQDSAAAGADDGHEHPTAEGQCAAVRWMQEDSRDVQDADEGWVLAVSIPTANLNPGAQYVLRFRGSRWPRGALSGLRLVQPPPFTFSVDARECSGHGTLEDDGTCVCQEVGQMPSLCCTIRSGQHGLSTAKPTQRSKRSPSMLHAHDSIRLLSCAVPSGIYLQRLRRLCIAGRL